MAFHLYKNEPLDSGLRRIAFEQIDIVLNGFGDESVPLDKRVHSLRARCKKMRGLLRLLQPRMGAAFEVENQRFRSAAKELAGYREMEVHRKTIESLAGRVDGPPPEPVEIPQEVIVRSLMTLATCRDAIDHWPVEVHDFSDLAPGLERTYAKVLDACDATQRDPVDPNFHQLRKHGKYHWYQIRILERLNKPMIRGRRQALRQLQLMLGDAHDLALLEAYLGMQDEVDEPLLQKAITRKNELYAAGMATCREVYATSVDEIVGDFSRWWDRSRPEARAATA